MTQNKITLRLEPTNVVGLSEQTKIISLLK